MPRKPRYDGEVRQVTLQVPLEWIERVDERLALESIPGAVTRTDVLRHALEVGLRKNGVLR